MRYIRQRSASTIAGAETRGRLSGMRREPNIRCTVNLVIGKSGNWVVAVGGIATLLVTLTAAQRPPQARRSELVWVDRAGKKLSAVTGLADFGNIELSPDRKQIAAA